MGVSAPPSLSDPSTKPSHGATTFKLGMYGGAFDPPHRAHVSLAKAARQHLSLDLLKIFPTGQAWHKSRTLTPAWARLAMTQLAFEGIRHVQVDGRETNREGPTYTIDTLEALQHEYPHVDLYLILGQDQAMSLHTWHRAVDIVTLANVAIAHRAHPDHLHEPLPVQALLAPQLLNSCKRVELIPFVPITLSATEIRARVAAEQSITAMVSPAVARYIAQHDLYRAKD